MPALSAATAPPLEPPGFQPSMVRGSHSASSGSRINPFGHHLGNAEQAQGHVEDEGPGDDEDDHAGEASGLTKQRYRKWVPAVLWENK